MPLLIAAAACGSNNAPSRDPSPEDPASPDAGVDAPKPDAPTDPTDPTDPPPTDPPPTDPPPTDPPPTDPPPTDPPPTDPPPTDPPPTDPPPTDPPPVVHVTDTDGQMLPAFAPARPSLFGEGFAATATAMLGSDSLTDVVRLGQVKITGTVAGGTGFADATVTVGATTATLPNASYRGAWTWAGPSGGDIRDLDAVGDADAFAATGNGVYRSLDHGATWNRWSLALANLDVRDLAVASAHPTRVVAATPGGVYRSNDQGEWSRAGSLAGASRVAIAPDDPELLLAASGSRLYRSTDGGNTWGIVLEDLFGVNAIAFAPDGSRVVLARGTNELSLHDVVLTSSDHGATWANAGVGLTAEIVSLAFGPEAIYAAGFHKIFKSTDGAATWTELPYSVPLQSPARIAVDAVGNVYVASSDTGVVVSTDGGKSWTERYHGAAEPDYPRLGGFAVRADTGELYLGVAQEGVLRSADGGTTFVRADANMDARTFTEVATSPAAAGLAIAVAPTSVWRTVDHGATWKRASIALSILPRVNAVAIHPTAAWSALLGTSDGVYRSTNGGASWTRAGIDHHDIQTLLFDPAVSTRFFAGAQQGIFRSLDSGATWTKVLDAQGTGITSLIMRGTAVLALSNGRIMRSTDGGATWAAFGTKLDSAKAIYADPTAPGNVYALAGYATARVYRSTDGAATWTAITPADVGIRALAVDPSRPATVYLATSNGAAVLRSLTGLQTRWAFDLALPANSVRAIAIDASGRAVYLATDANGLRRIGP